MSARATLTALLLTAVTTAVPVAAGASSVDAPAKPGSYAGSAQDSYDLTFKVSGNGRSLSRLRTAVVVYCIGVGTQNGPVVKTVTLPTIPLSKSGTFDRTVRTEASDADSSVRVRGDVDGSRLTRSTLTYLIEGDGFRCETDGPASLVATRGRG